MTGSQFAGNLADDTMGDVIARAHRQRFTGTVTLCRGTEARRIFVSAGVPVWAVSTDPERSLAAFLFRRGHMALRDLSLDDDTSAWQRAGNPTLARDHVQSLVLEPFTWANGTYTLEPGTDAAPHRVDLILPSLLADGVRRVEEAGRLLRACGGEGTHQSFMLAPARRPELIETLAADARATLQAIVSGWVGELSLTDCRLLQCVWELKLLGLIEPCAPDRGVCIERLLAPAVAPAPALEVTMATVTSEPLPELEVLDADVLSAIEETAAATPAAGGASSEPLATAAIGVESLATAPLAVVETPAVDTALALSARIPPVQASAPPPSRPPRPAMSGAPGTVVTLLNPAELAGDGNGPKEARGGPTAAEWFQTGMRFLEARDIFNAVRSFEEAVRLEPHDHRYRHKLGTAQAKNPKWRKQAEENLIAASDSQPWNPQYHLALARLYRDSHLTSKAIARYKSAAGADPANQEARRGLAEMAEKEKPKGATARLMARLTSPVGKGGGRPSGSGGDDDVILS